jgi:hypothetical protein
VKESIVADLPYQQKRKCPSSPFHCFRWDRDPCGVAAGALAGELSATAAYHCSAWCPGATAANCRDTSAPAPNCTAPAVADPPWRAGIGRERRSQATSGWRRSGRRRSSGLEVLELLVWWGGARYCRRPSSEMAAEGCCGEERYGRTGDGGTLCLGLHGRRSGRCFPFLLPCSQPMFWLVGGTKRN